MFAKQTRSQLNPMAYWAVMILGALLAVLGIVIGAGGVWLLALGGSFYYLIAGVGLLAAGVLILAGRVWGVYTYFFTYLFTLVWALWEVGLDGWAQVPRLVAPTIILILVLVAWPALRKLDPAAAGRTVGGHAVAAIAALIAVGGVMFWYVGTPPNQVLAQDTPAEPQVEEPADPDITPDEEGQTPASPATDEEAPASPASDEQDEAPAPAADETADTPAVESSDEADPASGGETATSGTQADTGLAPASVPLAQAAVGADWPAYGGTYQARRYSPLDQITPENVANLEKVWTYRSGDMPNEEAEGKYSPENTPLKVGDDLYTCTAMGIGVALDAATGREEWRYEPNVPEDAIPYGATCRGVAYFENPEADSPDAMCATRIVWGTLDARLIAVDARTGQPCSDFGRDGEVFLEEGIGETVPGWYSVTSPPTIVRGVIVIGAQVQDGQAEDSPSGVVRGYDAVSGELVWAWDLGNPGDYQEPPEGEVYTRGTPNMWTMAAADEELGYVYLPLGNSAVDYYGSNRSELENEYATSLVAVDATTGEDVWHFQTVHHDVWDYDLGSQPSLVEFPTDEGTVPAIILSSKQGDIYVLNRETGESLFPVEEREVPTDMGVEQDYLSETQPFSTYHSLAFEPLTEKDMWGMSPLDQLWCRIQFRQANYQGMYTPPTTEGHWIQYPGYNGGQDWGSMAVDTERGLLIANYNDMPNYNRLIPRDEAEHVRPIFAAEGPAGEAGPQIGSPYAISVNAGWRESWTGLMCKQPPYGGIRAIDLETGETVWDRPLGTARANGPFGIPSMLPFDIGTPNNGGPIATAGGLIFIGAATDNLLRAIDIETGETVWQDVLPAGGQTTPITYEVGGRQFIAFAPGGHHFMETPIGDYLIAYALPE